ncbi:MAG: futalosine hydrolase [Thermodesulfobacteriota bacterium]
MILLVAATDPEAAPLLQECPGQEVLVSGVGVMETALRLTRRLAEGPGPVELVINFGIGGAFPGSGAGLLDVCLAEREVLADLGICRGEAVEPLPMAITGPLTYPLSIPHVDRAAVLLARRKISCHCGVFVTVSSVSATTRRGELLRQTHNGLCENMEGAAVARVCQAFGIPCLEVRAISNMVEERDPEAWRIASAIRRCAEALAFLLADGVNPSAT